MVTQRLGRNDLCRCGSGKKYKKCCLRSQPPAGEWTGPTGWAHPPGQPNAAPPPTGEWTDYYFVKGKGWTHKKDLKPGDQYKVKEGGWETVQPERLIRTTQEHPFWVKDKGWTPAGEIKVGDLVRTIDGWVPITKIEDTGKYEPVYNLRVADHHTYFVGDETWGFAVWAHNVYIQHLPGADAALTNVGTVYALRAKQIYDDLVRRNEKGLTTIAVSQITDGGALREIVVVYGPSHVFQRIEAALIGTGAVVVHAPMGGAHAEEYLYNNYHAAPGFTGAIGISHKDGPCPTCRTFFNGVGFRNIWWDKTNSM